MFRFFQNLPEELILKIFQELSSMELSLAAQADKTFNRISNDTTLALEKQRIEFLIKAYAKLPSQSHLCAIRVRDFFKLALGLSEKRIEKALAKYTTPLEFSTWMEGFFKGFICGANFGNANKENHLNTVLIRYKFKPS